MALDFFAGCLGGCAGVLVGHPFDTVKVRLQTQCHRNVVYRGTINCASTIIKQESVKGLFKGMSSPMAGLAAINAIVFGVYGNVLRATSSPNSLQNQFFAGSAAGFAQCFVTSPVELAKIRIQLQLQSSSRSSTAWNSLYYKNPLDCLLKTVHSEGLLGIYRGLWCTILRDAPAFGVYFAGYEFMYNKAADSKGNVRTIPLLIVGGFAGVLSWIVCYPLDVAKTRLQMDGIDGHGKRYKGMLDCFRKIYNNEGIIAFSRGLNSTLIRAFPTNAVTFGVVSWVVKVYESSVKSKINTNKVKNTLSLDNDIHTI